MGTILQEEHPDTTGEVSDLLTAANAADQPVIPVGGGMSLSTGRSPAPGSMMMHLDQVAGVIAYEPADLTLSVRAGTSLASIQRELGAHGQELPIDVPHPERASIGGLVATGFAGPRRLRSGSLRDLLIGCEYVRGDGLVAKAGGMVVKNVSGFEIPRLLHGSWGSLAVLTSVNLKVNPEPRHDGTLIALGMSLEAAVADAQRLLTRFPSIDACTVTREGPVTRLAIRFLGRKRAVAEALLDVKAALPESEEMSVLEDDASRAYWQYEIDVTSETFEGVVIAIGCRPSQVAAALADIERMCPNAEGLISVSPGTGTIRMALPVSTNYGDLVRDLRASGRGVIVEAGAGDDIDPWGSDVEGAAVMRAIKTQFDPAGILNRGRLFL